MAKRQAEEARSEGSAGHTQIAYEGIRRMLFHSEIMPGQKISYRHLSERLISNCFPTVFV